MLFFVAVYAPAFSIVALFHLSTQIAIPFIIAASAAVACLIMLLRARTVLGLAGFGFRRCPTSYLIAALVTGILIGGTLAWLLARYPAPAPFDTSKLPLWMIFIYFVLAAPVQEELIFRGLLQTTLAGTGESGRRWDRYFPVLFVAGLFGVAHLEAGLLVAAAAVVLAVIAGEFRRTSGSLAPAILVHALFNAAQVLWPAH